MTRTGWSKSYNSILNIDMDLQVFKKKAQTVRGFNRNPTKRIKTLDVIFEENTLFECRIYNEVKINFFECKQERDDEAESTERSRKVPNEKINHVVLYVITGVIDEYLRTHPSSNMTGITKTIQAAQLSYQHASAKQFKPSTWWISIENRMDN